MAKYAKEKVLEDQHLTNEVDEEPVFDPEDFIFIVRPDGSLKEVLFPSDDVYEYSKKLLKVFAVFGIKHPEELLYMNETIH